MEQEFYTIAEVAKLLRVSRQTINIWIASGKVKTIKVGRFRLIPARVLQELTTVKDSEVNHG